MWNFILVALKMTRNTLVRDVTHRIAQKLVTNRKPTLTALKSSINNAYKRNYNLKM